MEYKEDVKTGNNAGDNINNIASEKVDYHDIAYYIKWETINAGINCKELVQGINNVPKADFEEGHGNK